MEIHCTPRPKDLRTIRVLTKVRDSDLTSLASDVKRGIWENGRRYHSYGKSRKLLHNIHVLVAAMLMIHSTQNTPFPTMKQRPTASTCSMR
jgi:hypothetical protein